MKISEVYKKFSIPPNLQQHMLTVAKVSMFILDHWTGPVLSNDKVIKMALVHDLGNLIKYDLDNYSKLLGMEQVRVDFWREKQKELISKYGVDDNKATKMMLMEIGFDNGLIELIYLKRFSRSVDIKNSDNFSLKILLYSDMRVLPSGVGTLEERIDDISQRYSSVPNLEELFGANRSIEKQLQKMVDISLSEINSKQEIISDSELLNIEI